MRWRGGARVAEGVWPKPFARRKRQICRWISGKDPRLFGSVHPSVPSDVWAMVHPGLRLEVPTLP